VWVPIEVEGLTGWVNARYLAAGEIYPAYTVVGVAADDVLNVRDGAGVTYAIVGAIPPHGMGVRVTGSGVRVEDATWVPVRYGQVEGWVNASYLARQVGGADESATRTSSSIVMALAAHDMEAVADYVHPDLGVRISPYTYVRADGPPAEQDIVLSADEVRGAWDDPTVRLWGVFDGSGLPIEMTFAAYWARFIYDQDYARPHAVGFNATIGHGNTINNIAEVYPDATVVEYHFAGLDPNLMGLDWRSLRLVLQPQGGKWYLVGIVHDEWTI